MLHTSRSPKPRSDAAMFVFNFAASLFSENLGGLLYKKYFHPILSSSIEGFTIPAENPLGQEIRDLTMEIYALAPSAFGYELEGLKCASQVWMAVLRYMEENKDALLYRVGGTLRTERMKEILSYIHRNYKEKIIVDDIAKHVNISRSECFRCFKRFMNKRPNEYINEYRLSKAAVLLKDTEKSITDICTECGFVSASYFTKVFKELYAMTPLQFRTMK
jgi:AraC-like DNA-binding protein